MTAQTAGSSAPGLTFLIPERDRFVIETDDAGIGEGDTKDVAGEVLSTAASLLPQAVTWRIMVYATPRRRR